MVYRDDVGCVPVVGTRLTLRMSTSMIPNGYAVACVIEKDLGRYPAACVFAADVEEIDPGRYPVAWVLLAGMQPRSADVDEYDLGRYPAQRNVYRNNR